MGAAIWRGLSATFLSTFRFTGHHGMGMFAMWHAS